jgi:hypothetical protein
VLVAHEQCGWCSGWTLRRSPVWSGRRLRHAPLIELMILLCRKVFQGRMGLTMSESVYDRCQRTTELIEGRVPCRIGLKPVFSVVDLAGICLIALIRQRSSQIFTSVGMMNLRKAPLSMHSLARFAMSRDLLNSRRGQRPHGTQQPTKSGGCTRTTRSSPPNRRTGTPP